MSEMLGADVEELRALAKDFAGNSQKLVQAQRVLDDAVNQLPRYWQGPDAQRFASQWRGQLRGSLSRAASMLDETSSQLKTQAAEQEQASSVSSLSGSWVPGAGGAIGGATGGGADSMDKPFWEFDQDGNWFDNYVKRPWDIYKFAPDTLKNLRDIAFTGDLLLHSKDLKAAWGTPHAVANFMDTRWYNGGPVANFMRNGASLVESGNYADSLAQGTKIAGSVELLGKGLGWAGVAIDAGSAVNKIANGNVFGVGYTDGDVAGNIKAAADSGLADAARMGIGIAAMVPGPQQPFAIVAAGAIAIYDNWDKIEDAGQWLGTNAPKAIEAVGDFAKDSLNNTADAIGEVVKDPGKLLPWNW